MKFPTTIKWGFNPLVGVQPPVLKSELGRIIWGGIRTQHIVDQYFTDNCYQFLQSITETPPQNAKALYDRAVGCNLGCYGTTGPDNRFGRTVGMNVPNMGFWGGMFDALTGRVVVDMEYPKPPVDAVIEGKDVPPRGPVANILEAANKEVERLKAQGWEKADFAAALKQELTGPRKYRFIIGWLEGSEGAAGEKTGVKYGYDLVAVDAGDKPGRVFRFDVEAPDIETAMDKGYRAAFFENYTAHDTVSTCIERAP